MLGGAERTSTKHEHVVQFYEDEGYLGTVVGDFLAAGAAAGEPLVVICTEAHRKEFCRRLEQRGLDPAVLTRDERLLFLDARATLMRFMVDGLPDPQLFMATVGPVLERLHQHGRGVRAYGEMVDLLWRDGNAEGAIRLEGCWNEISKTHRFLLLCAYALGNFRQQAHGEPFARICGAHSHVLPSESFSALVDPHARLREVSLLQQRAATLEAEVAHRTRVEAALLSALRVRDEFLSAAGHELRTPLTALLLQVQSLASATRTGQPRPDVPGRLAKIEGLALRLADLVDTLLDVSVATTAGGLSVDTRPADLITIVRGVLEQMDEEIQAARCRIRFVAEQPVAGEWDAQRIGQVVASLLSNAIKFGHGKPVDIGVRMAGSRAILSVRDEGFGLATEDQARVFDRFERAIPCNHFGGFGVGLWLSKQIVEAHGGEIRVDSVPGAGATFTVVLPLRPRG